MNMYETLNNLKAKQPTERKQAKYIYLDERTEQIKERPLQDSAGASAHINKTNDAQLIHRFMFRS